MAPSPRVVARKIECEAVKSPAEHDRRLMDLVSAALQVPPEERDSYLLLACQGDDELFREAAEVAKAKERMGSFLLHPAVTLREFPRPFEAGELVGERFQIIREIGEGGMGVVYEAFDQKREMHIAIKSAKPGFQRLLSPELEGAIKVAHPNVCRVNEIHTAHTEHGEVDFLTMELLAGETLATYIETRGKLTEDDALVIARQLCGGLAEAHRSGVIHRDLKSANVILCHSANGDLRAVITDFGLAGDRTRDGDFAGTPRYIAPELWRGEKASIASDIYALGVVLDDMVAGPPQHDGDAGSYQPETFPPAPKIHTDGLSRRWARTILQCLDPSPEARPADATEVLADLDGRPSGRLSLLALALLTLVTFSVPPVREWLHDRIWPPLASVRLVVLPVNGSNSSALPSSGVLQDAADRISQLRSGSHPVVVIAPKEALEMQVETPEQAQKVFHATHALQTAMHHEGEDLVVVGSVIDLTSETHVKDFSGRYSPETVGTLPGALAGEVSAGLGLRGTAALETLAAAATVSYDRGLYLLRDSQNTDDAIGFFREAARLDPGSPLPLTGLVLAEIREFEDTKEAAHLNQAQLYLTKAEGLNPDSVRVHLAAGKLSETTGKFTKALEQYLRVRDLEPGNIEASESLARVYDKLDEPENAVKEYRTAIKLEPEFYEPYEEFGVFYYFRGKYSEAAEQFKKVIDLAPRMYRAYLNLAASLENLGRYAEAEPVLSSALELRTTADALNNMGTLLAGQGRDAEAVPYYTRAVALSPNDYVSRLNLGDSYRHLGLIGKSKAEYRKGLDLARAELNQTPDYRGYVRALVAYFCARLGDRRRAEDEIGQALRQSPGNNRAILRAVLTYEALGQRSQAIATLSGATPDLLRELDRDPDLADFCNDLRFKQLVERISKTEENNHAGTKEEQ
jgi:serine/threonine protein kinase/Flp pilus assembly protein TadD